MISFSFLAGFFGAAALEEDEDEEAGSSFVAAASQCKQPKLIRTSSVLVSRFFSLPSPFLGLTRCFLAAGGSSSCKNTHIRVECRAED